MNRWHVYEWMKQAYLETGKVQTRKAALRRFADGMDVNELQEGMIEFFIVYSEGRLDWVQPAERMQA